MRFVSVVLSDLFAFGELKRMTKTVIFEDKYGVNINDFSTTEEVDVVIEKEIGRKMGMVRIDSLVH